ncbi:MULTISPECIES: TetR/AcrR family transcriptional regulator [unclassified Lysinibacillus]|uniref:TetR/AcrR family transcriptional regulator n=1 Tax=unclassified Lysinibacillus TaxID=2636778 RepID=UPI002013BC86|nr:MULTISPECIES: TetR/AcrR family transcriptional regulator [unclassified Lysinibacillus]MCL1697574.1 TetR/AcrR family transcriptional regulator [Lysinibacillus sp. BPa_S21]MCL1699774.1 TetR/AcrR family transcriptional regulator [Lysinibacillus sp. Bpr_S20]
MNKRREQKEVRREQILNAGLDLFIRNGYQGTTTKEIGDSVGISQGLMFHYFGSKEEVYLELLNRAKMADIHISEEELEQPLVYLNAMVTMILDSFNTYPLSAKLFMLVAQTLIASNLPDSIQQVASDLAASENFERLVKEGQVKGVIRDGDPKALAGCFYSAIQGVAQTYVCFPDIPLPQSSWLVDILKK